MEFWYSVSKEPVLELMKEKIIIAILVVIGLYYGYTTYLAPLPTVELNAAILNRGNPSVVTDTGIEYSPVLPAEYYVLYSSASWCGPCRQAAPQMIAWYETNVIPGKVTFVMVSFDDTEEKASQYMRSTGMPWPFVMADSLPPALLRLGGSGIPRTVVTDRTGKVLATSTSSGRYLGPFEPLSVIK